MSALYIDFSWMVVTVLTRTRLFIAWESVLFYVSVDRRLEQSHEKAININERGVGKVVCMTESSGTCVCRSL